MRRTAVLKIVAAASFTVLGITVGACASSEPADLNNVAQDNSATQPAGSSDTSKLPPSSGDSSNESTPADAGPKDSAAPKDSGSSTPADSGTASGTNTTACDPNNGDYDVVFGIALITGNLPPCPCSSSECCYNGITCLPQ